MDLQPTTVPQQVLCQPLTRSRTKLPMQLSIEIQKVESFTQVSGLIAKASKSRARMKMYPL